MYSRDSRMGPSGQVGSQLNQSSQLSNLIDFSCKGTASTVYSCLLQFCSVVTDFNFEGLVKICAAILYVRWLLTFRIRVNSGTSTITRNCKFFQHGLSCFTAKNSCDKSCPFQKGRYLPLFSTIRSHTALNRDGCWLHSLWKKQKIVAVWKEGDSSLVFLKECFNASDSWWNQSSMWNDKKKMKIKLNISLQN